MVSKNDHRAHHAATEFTCSVLAQVPLSSPQGGQGVVASTVDRYGSRVKADCRPHGPITVYDKLTCSDDRKGAALPN